ncbi:asialoglycoprotein receptor 2 isoform X2 [Salmo salar]|uniref:Asialoglycoprotein receptor 2 isoform X2 n=1 Tax=Salmo salar TaxID=8030 RepID=A0ABM3EGF8_SALSA|nr:asialoglycoprotein receptor 2-like isoform X2 [Salmo salar]
MQTMDIDDDTSPNKPSVTFSVHFQWWKRPSGVAAVCLGLLCVLLLAGIIGLSVYYGVIDHHCSTERDQHASYSLLTKGDQQPTSYNNLTKEGDQIQTNYNTLTEERDQLQNSLNTRTTERDQLQNSLNTTASERDQLQNSLNTTTTERDQFKTRLRFYEKPCVDGWWKFGTSCYYVSSTMDTGGGGQKDCRTMGADLVIINSREEQIFINGFKKNVWIGAYKKDAIWKWVGDTPFKPTWRGSGESNNADRILMMTRAPTSPGKGRWRLC